jgi:hypothetical protein
MTREELVAIQEQLKSDQSAAIDADKKVLQLTEQLSSAKQASPKLMKELENLRADYKSFKERVSTSKESFKQAAERKWYLRKDKSRHSRKLCLKKLSKTALMKRRLICTKEKFLGLKLKSHLHSSPYLTRGNTRIQEAR